MIQLKSSLFSICLSLTIALHWLLVLSLMVLLGLERLQVERGWASRILHLILLIWHILPSLAKDWRQFGLHLLERLLVGQLMWILGSWELLRRLFRVSSCRWILLESWALLGFLWLPLRRDLRECCSKRFFRTCRVTRREDRRSQELRLGCEEVLLLLKHRVFRCRLVWVAWRDMREVCSEGLYSLILSFW